MGALSRRSQSPYMKDYFSPMGSLQQATEPVPPLVTMNSDPHLAQIYLFPVSFATYSLPVLRLKTRLSLVCNQGPL